MLKDSCPGSNDIKQPKPEDIACRKCGTAVEMWSDETEAKCEKCGQVNSRVLDPSCIDWCAFAKECVGDDKYKRLKTGQNGKN